MENQTTILPKLDDLANAANYVMQGAEMLRQNGLRIVGDLVQIEQALLSEANSVRAEAETRSAALFERASQVRKMIEFHTGQTATDVLPMADLKVA